jgi:hypothetical protein
LKPGFVYAVDRNIGRQEFDLIVFFNVQIRWLLSPASIRISHGEEGLVDVSMHPCGLD